VANQYPVWVASQLAQTGAEVVGPLSWRPQAVPMENAKPSKIKHQPLPYQQAAAALELAQLDRLLGPIRAVAARVSSARPKDPQSP